MRADINFSRINREVETLYGIGQAARQCVSKLSATLSLYGFEQSSVNPCLLRMMDGEGMDNGVVQ